MNRGFSKEYVRLKFNDKLNLIKKIWSIDYISKKYTVFELLNDKE